jgi:hypothetical protein
MFPRDFNVSSDVRGVLRARGSCAAKEQFPMVDSGRLAKAGTVLAHAPELVG